MRILVIGGTRFIGPYVVRRLVEEGHSVTVFHRGETEGDLPDEVRHIHGDRHQMDAFAGEFRQLAPEVVLDMKLMTEQEAHELVQMFKSLAKRLVMISSGDVYRNFELLRGVAKGPSAPLPFDEDSPLREHLYPNRAFSKGPDDWLYHYEKILCERVLMNEPELPCTVLRLPAVYGPGDYQHRLFYYLKRMDDHRPAILLEEGQDQWRWTRGYVENVADAIVLAINSPQAMGRIYNVGEKEALTEANWVRSIGQAVGWQGEVLALPKEQLPASMQSDSQWQYHIDTDTNRIREELGYTERVSRPEALARTIAWERTHPPAEIKAEEFDYAAEDEALNKLKQTAGQD